MTIRLVLDASAVLSFSHGDVHVGELLTELEAEGAIAGLPVACLAEAFPAAVDAERVHLLVEHPAVQVVGESADDWQPLSGMVALVGDYPSAAAAWLALDCGGWVLTNRPSRYVQVAGGTLTIPIGG